MSRSDNSIKMTGLKVSFMDPITLKPNTGVVISEVSTFVNVKYYHEPSVAGEKPIGPAHSAFDKDKVFIIR